MFNTNIKTLKEILHKYGSALGFILRFVLVYVVLTMGYNWYLSFFGNTPDAITALVAEQNKWLLEVFGYQIGLVPDASETFYQVWLYGRYVARIVEGCNALSVIILFITFIIAFKGSAKHTLVFGLAGMVFLYVINLLRIVLLIMVAYHFPEYTDVMHSVVFPAIIYGGMFLLWVIWVRQFAKK